MLRNPTNPACRLFTRHRNLNVRQHFIIEESQLMSRPTLNRNGSLDPITAFVSGLQKAIDTGDAVRFNSQFAQDVLWGSPFGAVAVGYDQIHSIHTRMFGSISPIEGMAKYTVEHSYFPTDDVAIAYVRRTSSQTSASISTENPGSFDELAMIVLVKHEDQWWLAAAQHVPDRRDVYLKW